MKLLLKVKNGTPPMRKQALRQITDKARELGAGPLFNQILPLLMSPTLEDQERPAPCDVYTHIYTTHRLIAPANALLHARCLGPLTIPHVALCPLATSHYAHSPRRTMPTRRAEGRNPGHLPPQPEAPGGRKRSQIFPSPGRFHRP